MTLLNQATGAETTTGNLLTNSDFEDNIVGWTLSDKGVKIDGPYSDAGNSKIIRFKGQDSTISQLVNLTAVEEGKEILSYTISYHGYGCGNDANGHCTQENHDKIITNISFTDGSNTEVSSHSTSVIYEDGFTHHTFTKSINDTFLTGMVAINFELTGQDSHTGNNWLAPITDNYEFAITYQDYVQQQAQEQIVQETMIGGLQLDTSVTLDLISDIQIMPEMEMIEMPMDMQPMEINMDMPEMEMNVEMPENSVTDNMQVQEMPDIIDIPQTREIRIEMPSDLPEIAEVQPIEEIKEINVEGPSEPEPEIEVVEAEPEPEPEAEPEPETKTEPKTKTKIAANESGDLSDGGEDESDNKTEKSDDKKEKSSKEKSNSKKTSAKKETVEEKTTVKSTKQPVDKTAKSDVRTEPLGEVSITNMVLLQIIPETIIIEETVSLTQEAIYEQDINAFTSSATYDSLISSSSSRWLRMVDVRPKHTFSGYGR